MTARKILNRFWEALNS